MSGRLNLYLISQDVNRGDLTFDSAVVAAETEDAARLVHPNGRSEWNGRIRSPFSPWCNAEDVQVKYLGIAHPSIPAGVVCASFNAW